MLNETPATKTDGAYDSMFPEQGVAHDAEQPTTDWAALAPQSGGCVNKAGMIFLAVAAGWCGFWGCQGVHALHDHNTAVLAQGEGQTKPAPFNENGVMDAPTSDLQEVK